MKYLDPIYRNEIKAKFSKAFPNSFPLNIKITSLNRLEYLKKCVWSIIAATTVPYKIKVYDDKSNDGTIRWLQSMVDRNLLFAHVNKKQLGSANNSNVAVKDTDVKVEWVVLIQDDIWVHKGWDVYCMEKILETEDCGILSFYNYTRLGDNNQYEEVGSGLLKGGITGMSANFLFKESYYKAKGFKLGKGRMMGYFATPFCKRLWALEGFKRNQVYFTKPSWATMMDMSMSNLNEIIYSEETGYNPFRRKEKFKIE